MSSIKIEIADIVNMDTDCIVNAANSGLRMGGGVCGAIFNAAGARELQAACDEIGGCPTGNAVITPGFKLKARYIIHAVGPVWNGTDEDRKLLKSCYIESLEKAREKKCHSVAFPLISAGIFGCPIDEAWEQAIKGCKEWIKKYLDYEMEIIFTVRKQHIKDVGDCLISR